MGAKWEMGKVQAANGSLLRKLIESNPILCCWTLIPESRFSNAEADLCVKAKLYAIYKEKFVFHFKFQPALPRYHYYSCYTSCYGIRLTQSDPLPKDSGTE